MRFYSLIYENHLENITRACVYEYTTYKNEIALVFINQFANFESICSSSPTKVCPENTITTTNVNITSSMQREISFHSSQFTESQIKVMTYDAIRFIKQALKANRGGITGHWSKPHIACNSSLGYLHERKAKRYEAEVQQWTT
jgi:hypothetical protein